MRLTIVCGLVVGGVLAGAALAAGQRPVEPGGKIGAMTVVRGATYDADLVMLAACPATFTKPGKYHWSCSLPRVPRLYIGVSHFAHTQKELEISWKRERWSLWVDGRPVDLPHFGTSDSRHPIQGKLAFFRGWKVTLSGAPSGRHTVHYLMKDPSGAYDMTTAVTIGR